MPKKNDTKIIYAYISHITKDFEKKYHDIDYFLTEGKKLGIPAPWFKKDFPFASVVSSLSNKDADIEMFYSQKDKSKIPKAYKEVKEFLKSFGVYLL